MKINEELLLELAKELVSFQRELLRAWRGANPSSSDTEMLFDFPMRCVVWIRSSDWTATKHGIGVRFQRTDGLMVDGPFGIDKPSAIDPNRLFDFLVSRPFNRADSLPRDRISFCGLFDQVYDSGCLIKHDELTGRAFFTIRTNEHCD